MILCPGVGDAASLVERAFDQGLDGKKHLSDVFRRIKVYISGNNNSQEYLQIQTNKEDIEVVSKVQIEEPSSLHFCCVKPGVLT